MTRWYQAGLRFECSRCGECCTGTPGYVWIDDRDVVRVADHLGLGRETFLKRFVRLVGSRMSLTEAANGDCVFLDERRACKIQPVKPRQCVTFPFWPRLLADPRNWQAAGCACPGMGQGRLYTADEIDVLLEVSREREVLCRIMTGGPG